MCPIGLTYGIVGVFSRRNIFIILMSIELMLNAVSLNFIAFARYLPQTMLQGQVFAIFIITIAAAEAAVGLAIILTIFKNRATLHVDDLSSMKD